MPVIFLDISKERAQLLNVALNKISGDFDQELLHFQDVGTYRLLLDIWERDPEQIRSLYDETIGPVDQYDQTNNTQLVQTLSVFFKHDESLTETAAELYAHRHTIRYRLEKIAEITGLSVFQTEHKERLGLGLKARSLFTS